MRASDTDTLDPGYRLAAERISPHGASQPLRRNRTPKPHVTMVSRGKLAGETPPFFAPVPHSILLS